MGTRTARHSRDTDPLVALAATTAVRRQRLLFELEIERYMPAPPPPVPRREPADVLRQRRRILNDALSDGEGVDDG